MIRLVWSGKFTRSVKKLARRKPMLLDDLKGALRRLEIDPFDPRLRTHALSGEFDGCWACTVTYDARLIFEMRRDDKGHTEIHLLNIGSHDEVY